jgi:hypothetical protein
MRKLILTITSIFFIFTTSQANMSNSDKDKAWDCSGIYMANYFLPSGEEFEYSMKEHSMASVKVLKNYALEIGIQEKEWDEGVNKGVDKYYGSKYDEARTKTCDSFLNKLVPDGENRVKKVIQTLY